MKAGLLKGYSSRKRAAGSILSVPSVALIRRHQAHGCHDTEHRGEHDRIAWPYS
jgi:hypothetical protein